MEISKEENKMFAAKNILYTLKEEVSYEGILSQIKNKPLIFSELKGMTPSDFLEVQKYRKQNTKSKK